jgi:multidrug efflux system membrane fusion protein
MTKWVWAALVLLFIGAAGWWYFDHQSGAPMTASEGARGSGTGRGGGGRNRLGGPVAVTTALVSRQDVPVHGIGTVQAYNTVTVRVRVDGQLDKVMFTEGQDVNAGDVLAQIDPRPYEAQLNQAQGLKAEDGVLAASAAPHRDQ